MFPRSCFFFFAALATTLVASPHRYDHVVVVIEENRALSQVMGNRIEAPYINSLADGGVSFTDFYGISHPSQPSYLHLFSGDNQGVFDNNRPPGYPWTTPNLGAALIAAGATFAGYSEDLFAIGDRDTTATYSEVNGVLYSHYRRKHNPWANWQAGFGEPVGLNQLAPGTNLRYVDFPASYPQIPDVAFVVPNQQNDMHDGTIRMADDWLRIHFGDYAQWARTHNSLLIVTFDEDNSSAGNRIPTVFYGAGVSPGSLNSTRWTLHNLLRTLGDMYGAAPAARAALVRPITGVFPGDPPVLGARFQQGLNGYTGCLDTTVRFSTPENDESTSIVLTADNQPAQMLVRFANLFGAGVGQIPNNATIVSAKLSLWTVSTSTNLFSVHRMLAGWNDTDSWTSLVNGVATDGVEAASESSFALLPSVNNAPAIFDVTSDLAALLAGATNYGWVVNGAGAQSWLAASSENASVQTRPSLDVAYSIPVNAGYSAWQLARFGAGGGGAATLPEEDADGDGIVNLLEYTLNSNPLSAVTADRPTVAKTGTAMTFSFTRNVDATDITLRVEATSNLTLTPWSPVATWSQASGWSAVSPATVTDIAGAVSVTEPAAGPRFYRILVTWP